MCQLYPSFGPGGFLCKPDRTWPSNRNEKRLRSVLISLHCMYRWTMMNRRNAWWFLQQTFTMHTSRVLVLACLLCWWWLVMAGVRLEALQMAKAGDYDDDLWRLKGRACSSYPRRHPKSHVQRDNSINLVVHEIQAESDFNRSLCHPPFSPRKECTTTSGIVGSPAYNHCGWAHRFSIVTIVVTSPPEKKCMVWLSWFPWKKRVSWCFMAQKMISIPFPNTSRFPPMPSSSTLPTTRRTYELTASNDKPGGRCVCLYSGLAWFPPKWPALMLGKMPCDLELRVAICLCQGLLRFRNPSALHRFHPPHFVEHFGRWNWSFRPHAETGQGGGTTVNKDHSTFIMKHHLALLDPR